MQHPIAAPPRAKTSSAISSPAPRPHALVWMAWIMLGYTGLLGQYPWLASLPLGIFTPNVGHHPLIKTGASSLAHSLPFFQGSAGYSLCLFQQCVGLPCLFCGITRSFALLSHGAWQASLHYHLLGIPLYAATWGLALFGLACPDAMPSLLARLQDKRVLGAALVALTACWIWKLFQNPAFW